MNEERLLEHQLMKTATDLHTMIAKLPSEITSEAHLLEMIRSFEFSITDHLIAELRKKYQVFSILLKQTKFLQ
jgi:hypothetical protein